MARERRRADEEKAARSTALHKFNADLTRVRRGETNAIHLDTQYVPADYVQRVADRVEGKLVFSHFCCLGSGIMFKSPADAH